MANSDFLFHFVLIFVDESKSCGSFCDLKKMPITKQCIKRTIQNQNFPSFTDAAKKARIVTRGPNVT